MRRPLIMLPAVAALAALAAFAALGCEDGPNQTFSAAPPNAANVWVGENVPPAAADAGQAFDAGYPTVSKTVLCSTDFKRDRWAWMLTQPISPPRMYAGLDIADGPLWKGLTITEAESPPASATSTTGGLCQSNAFGFEGTCPSGIGGCNLNSWGNNNEVIFSWNVATYIVDQMELQLGYTGTMTTNKYPDHTGAPHAWTLAVGDVIRRDGEPFEMSWAAGTTSPVLQAQITDIFNATMATFATAAGVPFDTSTCTSDTTCNAPGTYSTCECDHVLVGGKPTAACVAGTSGQCGIANCGTDGNCLVYNDGSTTIFGIRPMVVYVEGTAGVPQPALSTPQVIYNFYTKWEPFSNLPQTVKIDLNGPVALGTPVGVPDGTTTTCTQQIGQPFSDFQKNCVQVHNDATNPNGVDVVNLNKVEYGLTHDQEHWTANVLGVNQNFTSSAVINGNNCAPGTCPSGTESVVLDSDIPQPMDVAQDWTFDVRARGATWNDLGPYLATNPVYEMRGSALVMITYANLMLADIARILSAPLVAQGLPPMAPKTLGDPTCTGFSQSTGLPNYEGTTGCSGIEGMMIPNGGAYYLGGPQANFGGDPLDVTYNYDQLGIYGPIIKPGGLTGGLCIDPENQYFPTDCDANGNFSLWQNALNHVIRVLGGGNVLSLPSELQDRRYYFKWFGIAYIKYLKAYGNYYNKYGCTATNCPVNNFPSKFPSAGTGLGPTDVMNQQIDLESLFFDYTVSPGAGGAQTFDTFEYIDRDFLGQGNGGTYNWIPWDFGYGCDLFGGNQRYDNWYRRMDREEIALFSSMLTNKGHTAGQENNVNITNLFGSVLLGGNGPSAVAGVWPSYLCAIGQAGDPSQNCISGQTGGPVNPPLDPTNPSHAAACDFTTYPTNGCSAAPATSPTCTGGTSYENGYVQACGAACDFGTYPASGCASPSQTCVFNGSFGAEACLDMMMDKNGPTVPNGTTTSVAHPLLFQYPGAWQRTPFARGHSPITIPQAMKFPDIGVAKISIPNFVVDSTLDPSVTGPYTFSPVAAVNGACPGVCSNGSGTCATAADCSPQAGVNCTTGYKLSADGAWCNAAVSAGAVSAAQPGGNLAPSFQPLVPWMEVQPEVGFSIPLDAQHSQWVATGQLDFTGVLETYLVDYLPWSDPSKSSCVADGACNPGYTCDGATAQCLTNDSTIQIAAIEGADFLGQAFACIDPTTSDILHVGMYDSAATIVDWLAAHPGSQPVYGQQPSAQAACQILVIRSPYDNFIDFIVSKQYGVALNIGGGQGQGRVTDIVLFDPGLIQSL